MSAKKKTSRAWNPVYLCSFSYQRINSKDSVCIIDSTKVVGNMTHHVFVWSTNFGGREIKTGTEATLRKAIASADKAARLWR